MNGKSMSSKVFSLKLLKSASNALKLVWKSYKKSTYLSISNRVVKSNTFAISAESNLRERAHLVYLLALEIISSHNFLYLPSFSNNSALFKSISLTKNLSSRTAVSYIWISSNKGGTFLVSMCWKCDSRSSLCAS